MELDEQHGEEWAQNRQKPIQIVPPPKPIPLHRQAIFEIPELELIV
jgi:hypothetical protein